MCGTYHVTLENSHLLVVRVTGELPIEGVQALEDDVQSLLGGTPREQIVCLLDLSQALPVTPPARMYLVKYIQDEPFAAGAISEASKVTRIMANVTLTAAGVANQWQFFIDEASARAWLDLQVACV